MKTIKFLITAALAMLAFNIDAQQIPPTTFSVGGNNFVVSSNLTYCVVPGGQGRPRVAFVSATSDQAATQTAAGTAVSGGVLKLYSIQEMQPITLATTAATTNQLQIAVSTNFTSNTVCIVKVATNNLFGIPQWSYQRLVANTNTQTTNVTFSASTGGSVNLGDVVYRCRLEGTIPIGSATLNLVGSDGTAPIWTGQDKLPLLMEVQGNGTNVINLVIGGTYSP